GRLPDLLDERRQAPRRPQREDHGRPRTPVQQDQGRRRVLPGEPPAMLPEARLQVGQGVGGPRPIALQQGPDPGRVIHPRRSHGAAQYTCPLRRRTVGRKEEAMAVRSAEAEWKGNLREGAGKMKLGSGAYEGAYSFASRFEEGKGTNPEELIAAAHAGCFSMALSAGLGKAGFTPTRVHTTARV